MNISNDSKTHKLILLVFVVILISLVTTESLSESKTDETRQIELLLARVEAMQDVVFIRNGKEYSSKKAADHLRLKWNKAGRHVKTAEDFIDICGSRSSISGKPYKIRFPDGRIEDSAVILKELLQQIEKQQLN